MAVAPHARRFTVEEYEHMVRVGVFTPDDIPAGILDIHRGPGGHGDTAVRTARRGERVSPLAFPDIALPVDDILG